MKYSFLKTTPFFLYLLPLFFVLHGFMEGYHIIFLTDCLLLLAKYLVFTSVLHILLYFLYKNKSAVFLAFILMIVYFFFGAFHDFLKLNFRNSFLSRYAFVLPFLFCFIVIAFVFVKGIRQYERLFLYLNLLFLLFIGVDIFLLSRKVNAYDKVEMLKSLNSEFSVCTTCDKPDIYLIVTDEYAGEKTLNDVYNVDNSDFIRQLEDLKFHVINNSISNYNITPISMASLLNINYPAFKGETLDAISMRPIYNQIDTNVLVPFFLLHGYEFVNNSVFTVSGRAPFASQSFTPVNTRIIESQTLLHRLMKDLGFHLYSSEKVLQEDRYKVKANNESIIRNIKKQVTTKRETPFFIYSHLTMPHSPYYFNSKGEPYPEKDIQRGGEWLEYHYLEYLQYSNGVLLDLVDYILQNSSKPPVIILISDHGFRHYSKKISIDYDFYNLNATYLPESYVPSFHDGMSNVSYMRSLLNLLFKQKLTVNKQDKYFIPLPIYHNTGE
jgi:hypothetical protein